MKESEELENSQTEIQDASVLPSLSISDIPRAIETTTFDKGSIGNIPIRYIDQPTNGITHIRVLTDLSNVPERLRKFVPMFTEFFKRIGTKNYDYKDF